MKVLIFFVLFFLVYLSYPTALRAQNKAGINIGANHEDFNRAADMVGPGGWVVVMACPSDGDKIAQWVQRNVNVVIRGHFAGQDPDENLAKLWAATLASIPSPHKIYFMPWNEPNHVNEGGGPTAGRQVYNYVDLIKKEFQSAGVLDNKVVLLSPMVDKLNDSFQNDQFFTNPGGKTAFYYQTSGSSINEYDQFSPGPCSAGPNHNNCRYRETGIPEPYYALEAGVAGTCTPPCYKENELVAMLNTAWPIWKNDPGFKMFAIFSYDPHRPGDWNIFATGNQVAGYLQRIAQEQGGCCTQNITPTATTPNLKKCPDKNHSFYLLSDSECTECGGGYSLLYCKPIDADNFGEEYSRETLVLSQRVNFSEYDPETVIKDFGGKFTLDGVEIPLAQDLNHYFLGALVDNPQSSLDQATQQFLAEKGVFVKLASKDLQDRLKEEFLQEVVARGDTSRYVNFKVGGMRAPQLLAKIATIKTVPEIWNQIPLFANEETEGEIILEGDRVTGTIKTSVPEVYRLHKVTRLLSQMLTSSASTTRTNQAGSPPPGKTGPGEAVCLKEEIQPESQKNENLLGTAEFSNPQVSTTPMPERTKQVELRVKNKVPFLAQIADNTVGPKGFFKIFIPWLKTEGALPVEQETESWFEDVAGEDPVTGSALTLNLTAKSPNFSVSVSQKPDFSLLFHKLGTLSTVKDFISGRLLWPAQD